MRKLWPINALALLLLVLHTLKIEVVRVDAISMAILGALAAIHILPFVKKIKYGDAEAELVSDQVDKIKDDLGDQDKAADGPENRTSATIYEIAASDPVLAIAKLRIELETTIRSIYNKPGSRLSPSSMISELSKAGVLPGKLSENSRRVLSITNKVVHGEAIDHETMLDVVHVGVRLLSSLKSKQIGGDLIPEKHEIAVIADVERALSSQYHVVSIIPYEDRPIRNEYTLTSTQLKEYFDMYAEHAEIVISVSQVRS